MLILLSLRRDHEMAEVSARWRQVTGDSASASRGDRLADPCCVGLESLEMAALCATFFTMFRSETPFLVGTSTSSCTVQNKKDTRNTTVFPMVLLKD